MFAIAINYQNGRVAATANHPAGAAPEWPPHPDLVYIALVAAWCETGQDTAGQRVLRWLEGQAPPSLAAATPGDSVVHLIWPDANPSKHLPALRQLVADVPVSGIRQCWYRLILMMRRRRPTGSRWWPGRAIVGCGFLMPAGSTNW